MSQTLLEMAKDLVAEQIRVHHLSSDDAQALLFSTHATLLSLHRDETIIFISPEAKADEAGLGLDWKRSITKHAVICLECGDSFRQLSRRHLRIHDLDSRSYRKKHGIPSTQSLSSRQATARRRQLAKEIRPWEQAASKRAADQAAAEASIPKTGRAKRGRS